MHQDSASLAGLIVIDGPLSSACCRYGWSIFLTTNVSGLFQVMVSPDVWLGAAPRV